MRKRSTIEGKRFKITILAIIISACFGITAMIFSLPVAIITVALGGVQGVAIAFVAGDSYRQSEYDYNPPQDTTVIINQSKKELPINDESRMRYD